MPNTLLDSYTVRLRVINAEGRGISGLTVRALDHDRGREPDALGEGVTKEDGSLEISFAGKAAGGPTEGNPELFVLVHNPEGMLVHQSKPLSLTKAEQDLGDFVAHSKTIAAGSTSTSPPPVVGNGNAGIAPQPNDPSSVTGSNRFHGSARRDIIVPRSPFYHGPFGRLFRQLPA